MPCRLYLVNCLAIYSSYLIPRFYPLQFAKKGWWLALLSQSKKYWSTQGGEAKQISGMDSTALREQASVCIAILGSKADNTSCLSSIVPRM